MSCGRYGARRRSHIGDRGLAAPPRRARPRPDRGGLRRGLASRATCTRRTQRTGACCGSRKVDDHPLVRLTGSPTLFAVASINRRRRTKKGGKPPGYELLHVSRQRRRARRGDRRAVVWQYLHGAATSRRCSARTPTGSDAVGAVGRRHLVVADHRCEARRRCTSAPATRYSGPPQPTADAMHRVRSEDRRAPVGEAADAGRSSLAAVAGSDQLRREGRALTSISARRRCSPPLPGGRDHDRRSVRSPAWHTHSIPTRKGEQVLWRLSRRRRASIWGGIQWGTAVDATLAYFPVSDIYSADAGRPARREALDGRARVAHTTAAAGLWQARPRLQRGAVSPPSTVIPGIVFSRVERWRGPRATRRRTARSCGRSTPTANSRP